MSTAGPGVLVGPEGTGLNDFQRRRADARPELGYVAFAFDIDGARWFDDPEEMMARLGPLLAEPDSGSWPGGEDYGNVLGNLSHGYCHLAVDVAATKSFDDESRIASLGNDSHERSVLIKCCGEQRNACVVVGGCTGERCGQ